MQWGFLFSLTHVHAHTNKHSSVCRWAWLLTEVRLVMWVVFRSWNNMTHCPWSRIVNYSHYTYTCIYKQTRTHIQSLCNCLLSYSLIVQIHKYAPFCTAGHTQSVCVDVIEIILSCALILMFLDILYMWHTDLAMCDKKKATFIHHCWVACGCRGFHLSNALVH